LLCVIGETLPLIRNARNDSDCQGHVAATHIGKFADIAGDMAKTLDLCRCSVILGYHAIWDIRKTGYIAVSGAQKNAEKE